MSDMTVREAATVLLRVGDYLAKVAAELPYNLRVDGTFGVDASEEDHCGMILDTARLRIDEVLDVLRRLQPPSAFFVLDENLKLARASSTYGSACEAAVATACERKEPCVVVSRIDGGAEWSEAGTYRTHLTVTPGTQP